MMTCLLRSVLDSDIPIHMDSMHDQKPAEKERVDDEKLPARQDDPILDIFLKRVESKLKEKNLTRAGLAEHLDLSRNAISQFFLRKRRPNIDTLMKIAEALSVSVDFLVGRTEESEVVDLLQHKYVADLVQGFVKLSPAEQKSLMIFLHAMQQSQQTTKLKSEKLMNPTAPAEQSTLNNGS